MNLQIANIGIRQDAAGRYCMNDLHKAAGALSKDQPSKWLLLESTKELITELDKENLVTEQNQAVTKVQGGDGWQGTFVCKELVYCYAMWISPAFNLKVIRAYDALQSTPSIPQSLPEALRLAADLAEQNAILAPKAAIADRIASSDGWFSLRDAAKVLKVMERHLINWLLDKKWLYRDQKGKLRGYASITPRYINHKVTPIPNDADVERVAMQPMVTTEGLTRLAQLFNVEVTA